MVNAQHYFQKLFLAAHNLFFQAFSFASILTYRLKQFPGNATKEIESHISFYSVSYNQTIYLNEITVTGVFLVHFISLQNIFINLSGS